MEKVSQRVPWRNGGGWTEVLSKSPGGEPAEWRISVAEIDRDGPFSDFSGYDRTIVAQDASFTLEFADGQCVEVEPFSPLTFPGERQVFCRLHGSRATAFNVMTLRGAFAHDVRITAGEIEVTLIDVFADGPRMESDFESFDDWERARREFATWEALVKLRFAQNVHDERADNAWAARARLAPIAERRDAAMKRRLLASDARLALESRVGAHVFARWEQSQLAFEPAIEPYIAREAELYREYVRLTAGATYRFAGEEHTAASMGAFAKNPRREVRRDANACVWALHQEQSQAIDTVFDGLVHCRTAMARELGYTSYSDLAYPRLGRTDYDRADVRRLRDRIAAHVVPLCERIIARQARDLEIDAVMPWDEFFYDRSGPPQHAGDSASVRAALARAFASAHPALGEFARTMNDRGLFDLENRHGKRAGAFCSFFPSLGIPHVFANFTGTSSDVTSLVHEMGHAFQDYSSRRHAVMEYIIPPAETGEVFSLGLEYAVWPFYEEFFGEGASRYRSHHLKTMILMLPYIAAVDHFQELVYDNHGSGIEERYAFWKTVSGTYLRHRSTGGVPYLERGGAWHRQHHVFGFPFYYIDYALALLAAFDLWRRCGQEYSTTLDRYVEMAAVGGQLPFRKLLRTHEIADPFAEGTLENIVSMLERSKELA